MKAKSMTPAQLKKFRQSDAYDAASRMAEYPYGFDEDTADGREKAMIIDNAHRRLKTEWEAIYNAATGEGWNASPASRAAFQMACSAQTNADDTAITEKVCEYESAEYYRVALATHEGLNPADYTEEEPTAEKEPITATPTDKIMNSTLIPADMAIPAGVPVTQSEPFPDSFESLKSKMNQMGYECLMDADDDICIRRKEYDADGNRVLLHHPDPCDYKYRLENLLRAIRLGLSWT